MKITLTSVFVDDQDKALQFYTEILGFIKKQDFPAGKYKWLTVVSPDAPDGVQLLLEPDQNPASLAFKKSIFEQGIPATAFEVDDIKSEHERLSTLGVRFKNLPDYDAEVVVAIFDDTCGNYIQIYQLPV